MSTPVYVLGEALMDCLAQPDGTLRPLMGGSPFNMARAAALRGASVHYANPLSTDTFGQRMTGQLLRDGVQVLAQPSRLPTSLAVVQIDQGQPSYGFYREGIADRDYSAKQMLSLLGGLPPGIFHTGSLLLVPPEHHKTLAVMQGLQARGWTLSVDVNLRPKLADNLLGYVEAVREVMALADWLKASDEDLEWLGFEQPHRGNAPALAAQLGTGRARRIALTFGAQGAWLSVDGQQAQADVPVVPVVDTVGAGDTFWGNCVADWAMDPAPAADRVARTLERAMRAAAINCTRQGCQPPSAAELQAYPA